ncbi:hypothetical protein CDL12_25404 [Handroanthus impetiginosus]|uniref:DUF3511 domain-containing protein n=1 Tax=Handroanthus impetiginosus TaxID=429701 RepID=A0A2G9G9X5_9LAMI|nr:hypothetical protein CDL12_25404 [Handroanthus impetiginosus]
MADYRSKSYNDGKMQIEPYYGPPSIARPNDFRSYSVSYTSSSSSSSYYYAAPPPPAVAPAQNPKKGKSTSGSTLKSWSFNDPEFQRKRRVASYKVYSVEGKVKGSIRKSFRWLKNRYTQVLYGWW